MIVLQDLISELPHLSIVRKCILLYVWLLCFDVDVVHLRSLSLSSLSGDCGDGINKRGEKEILMVRCPSRASLI